MKGESAKVRIKRALRSVFRSMDFVAEHPALRKNRTSREAERLAEIYQQLGLAWEFLGLQCQHWDGYRKASGGKQVCRICGAVKGGVEAWTLLLAAGRKVIGHRTTPNSSDTFANKKAAGLLDDAIDFHGARLRVEVQNAYRSRIFRGHDITISADRMVKLEEGGIECRLDTHMVSLRLGRRKRGSEPPFGAFPSELSRKALQLFPVLLEYDRRGRFVGLCVFKPAATRKK